MPFTLKVAFTGICAFVPDQDRSFDDFQNPPTSATVVLPNLFRSKAVEGGTREPHIPTLELNPDLGWVGDRSPQLIAFQTSKRAAYFLKQERISFQATGAGVQQGLTIANPAPQAGPPAGPIPQANERDFFWWVPKMENIAPGSGTIRRELVNPGSNEVLGWVVIDRGRLSVTDLTPNVMSFKPIHGQPVHRQVVAKEITLEITGVEQVRISFEDHSDPNGVVTRTLSLADTPGGPPEVTIRVKNREIDELLGLVPEKRDPLPDIDFHAFYDMSSANIVDRLLPVDDTPPASLAVAAATPISIMTLLHGGVCPPAGFSSKTATVASVSQDAAASGPAEPRTARAIETRAAKNIRRRR